MKIRLNQHMTFLGKASETFFQICTDFFLLLFCLYRTLSTEALFSSQQGHHSERRGLNLTGVIFIFSFSLMHNAKTKRLAAEGERLSGILQHLLTALSHFEVEVRKEFFLILTSLILTVVKKKPLSSNYQHFLPFVSPQSIDADHSGPQVQTSQRGRILFNISLRTVIGQ